MSGHPGKIASLLKGQLLKQTYRNKAVIKFDISSAHTWYRLLPPIHSVFSLPGNAQASYIRETNSARILEQNVDFSPKLKSVGSVTILN